MVEAVAMDNEENGGKNGKCKEGERFSGEFGKVSGDPAETIVKCEKVIARCVKAPFLEGMLVNRFVNGAGASLAAGDVILMAMGSPRCPGNEGFSPIFLEAVPFSEPSRRLFAGVVVACRHNGVPEQDEIAPGEIGFACIGGIVPMVRVDSVRFVIEEGDVLYAGTELMAVPEKQVKGLRAVKLGIALADVEDAECFAPVLVGQSIFEPIRVRTRPAD